MPSVANWTRAYSVHVTAKRQTKDDDAYFEFAERVDGTRQSGRFTSNARHVAE